MKTFQEFLNICEAPQVKSKLKIRSSGLRSALTGMSGSLPQITTPSGKFFVPGSGESYGIGGTKLAT